MPKVALITGAARRVGAEIATTLHAADINVILHYNNSQKEAIELCNTLNQKRQHSAAILQADLARIEQCETLIQQAHPIWGRLDILVNNASRFYKTPLGHANAEAWDDLMNSNVKGPFFLSQAASSFLIAQHGCIINIADIHAERPMRDYSVYCISKAGLVMLTKALADELGPHVRVNAIAPGVVALPEGDNALSTELQQKILQRVPLAQHGHAKDIATAVRFLVEEGRFITGQVLAVDGGRSLSM